jgi:hypothetical protein
MKMLVFGLPASTQLAVSQFGHSGKPLRDDI